MVTYGAMSKKPLPIPAPLLIFKNLKFLGFWLSGAYAAVRCRGWCWGERRAPREGVCAEFRALDVVWHGAAAGWQETAPCDAQHWMWCCARGRGGGPGRGGFISVGTPTSTPPSPPQGPAGRERKDATLLEVIDLFERGVLKPAPCVGESLGICGLAPV